MVNGIHREDLKAKLRKRFVTLGAFERQFRLPASSVAAAMRRPHSRAESAIAKALDVPAWVIWPDRYDGNGRRLNPQPPKNYGRTAR